jgi:hypothetical protein
LEFGIGIPKIGIGIGNLKIGSWSWNLEF